MTELAAGAVSSLLVVVRNEALLLGGVRDDVQFIKEEMESMKSFLAHLARSAPPGGEHDEQVRTWMTQVRLLAQDCHNCIDLYLYSGNPHIHRAKGRLRHYLWWVYWFLRKLLAQHRAAVQLRQLKDRARDVGERRLRYGVEVPSKSAVAGRSPPAATRLMLADDYAAGDEDDEEDGDDDQQSTTDHSALFSRTLDDYVKAKLFEWRNTFRPSAGKTMSIAIVAPARDPDVLRLAFENMVFHPGYKYNRGYHLAVLINIPALHPNYSPLRPKEVLFYILRQLKHEQSQSQKQGTDQGEGEEEGINSYLFERRGLEPGYFRKFRIYCEKKRALKKIKENIKRMQIDEKFDKIKSDIQTRSSKGQQKKSIDQQDLHVLLKQLLRASAAASQQDQLKNKGIPKLSAADKTIIASVAVKLKERMEEDEQGGGGSEGGVGRGEENEALQEDCEGAEKEILEEERGEKETVEGGGGDIEEGGAGRGEILEQEHGGGGQGEILEHRGGDDDDDDDDEEEEEEEDDDDEDDDDDDDDEEEEEEEDSSDNYDSYDDYDSEEEEEEQQIGPIYLHENQYVHILQQVFLKTITNNKSSSKQATDIVLGEDQNKQMIDESKEENLLEPQEGKHDKMQETAQNTEDILTGIVEQKMDKIKYEFKEQLKIKGLVDDIKRQLKKKCPLFILKLDNRVDLPRWEDTRNALTLLECSADVLIVTTAKDIQQAKEYCCPQNEPIDYSLAGLYYDTVLKITKQREKEENYDPKIFRNILEQCEPSEFCMKLFTHALYVNPKRSNEELNNLLRILQTSPKSSGVLAKKMFKFSYTDMPKEYRSCFLYLAIFPPRHKIRRSTLIGRWVAEGLIFKEDWTSSVHRANRCFDEFISRGLADPAGTGAAGKVKSCIVGDQVHGFITKMARKQHILETRLSRHLARHFSIFNDLQLRSSDKIDGFFQRLSKSSRVSLLKVLDLEGCRLCFAGKNNQRYLKDICRKMLLLKYLSLRRTDITELPAEINNLRELEVLDIRQTKVPPHATAKILLLKLKRLLAGHIDLNNNPSNFASCGRIPQRIDKMVNMEILSNVKAQRSHDLKDIGTLCHLRKLGVVIDDKDSHLEKLLQAISDLPECLRSLSITTVPVAKPTSREALDTTPSKVKFPCISATPGPASADESPANGNGNGIGSHLKDHPKILQSLSIRGTTTTHKGSLLSLFIKGNENILAKVTLSDTLLSKDDLKLLANLPMLRCVRLQHIAKHMLTFEKDEFKHLKYLLVEGSDSDLTDISFVHGSAPELEKMVLSFTSSISGLHWLPKLQELELNNSFCGGSLSSFEGATQIAKLTLRGTELEQDALQSLTKNPNIRSLVLLEGSFGGIQNETTLEEDAFLWLNLLVVDCSAITKIVFTSGSAPRLEKIVWSSSTSLSGIDKLPRLKELEFKGGQAIPDEVKKAIDKHQNKPSLNLNGPET